MTLLETATIRDLERSSIRAFVIEQAEHFKGRVLDLGCGKQPYRDVIEAAGGSYEGWDRASLPANVSGRDVGRDEPLGVRWDTILSTQVVQYVSEPIEWLLRIRYALKPGGKLVLTGPTNWPIVEQEDRWRFTPTGIASLLNNAGFFVETVEERASVRHNGENWLLGFGAVARR